MIEFDRCKGCGGILGHIGNETTLTEFCYNCKEKTKTDFEKLKEVFSDLNIYFEDFFVGLDDEDPLVITIKDNKYKQCNFEFDPETEKFIKILM